MTKLDLLAFGPHPDDAELACGGTLARTARSGRRVGLVHLTRGEMGTRGTPEQRRREAEHAAEILGASAMEILDCGDGGLRTGPDEEDRLIEILRRYRPDVVLGPPPRDRHPDHGRAHDLVEAACFYAGVAKRSPQLGEPHRPGAIFQYLLHDSYEPDFVVDVTDVWDVRRKAVSAYGSQVYQGDDEGRDSDEPPTKIASRDFWHAQEGRARHFGALVGATFGEAFLSRLPLAVGDVLDLIPGGIR